MMEGEWVVAKIALTGVEEENLVLRELVGPVVEGLEATVWLRNFHFLRFRDIPGTYLMVRFLVGRGFRGEVVKALEKRTREVNDRSLKERGQILIPTPLDLSSQFTGHYVGRRFGEEGVEILLKYFEGVSRTFLSLLARSERDVGAHPLKPHMVSELLHFLTNLTGAPSVREEAGAYAEALQQHLLRLLQYGGDKERMVSDFAGVLGEVVDPTLGLRIRLVAESV